MVVTDVSGLTIGPVFKVQTIEEPLVLHKEKIYYDINRKINSISMTSNVEKR